MCSAILENLWTKWLWKLGLYHSQKSAASEKLIFLSHWGTERKERSVTLRMLSMQSAPQQWRCWTITFQTTGWRCMECFSAEKPLAFAQIVLKYSQDEERSFLNENISRLGEKRRGECFRHCFSNLMISQKGWTRKAWDAWEEKTSLTSLRYGTLTKTSKPGLGVPSL